MAPLSRKTSGNASENALSRFISASLGQLGKILILAILGQLGYGLRFVDLQDTHLGEVNLVGKTSVVFTF